MPLPPISDKMASGRVGGPPFRSTHFTGAIQMSAEEFMKQQYLTLRDEIRASKARIFFLLVFFLFYAVGSGAAIQGLAQQWPEHFWYGAVAYALGGAWFIVVLLGHWHSCTTTT